MMARIRTVELQPGHDGFSRPSSARTVRHVRPQILQRQTIQFPGTKVVAIASSTHLQVDNYTSHPTLVFGKTKRITHYVHTFAFRIVLPISRMFYQLPCPSTARIRSNPVKMSLCCLKNGEDLRTQLLPARGRSTNPYTRARNLLLFRTLVITRRAL